MKVVCETERLVIRQFDLNDDGFILRLLNEESFIRYIADKNVRTQADAIAYLKNGPLLSYRALGFGLNMVTLKGSDVSIGMCGLLKRDQLEYPDLGFAFLPEFCGKGYGFEAAKAVLQTEMMDAGLETVMAVTLPDNLSSNRLLKRVGFRLSGTTEVNGSQNNLYVYHR
ncbi:GNAT family N-acetyltransferase [Marinobacter sp. F4216]|uniref:GNAT family N-acetyltransferase n=1 Tax=Marinobacter sp. F4216 TaxID=2874281 RepID=UPI001CBFA336|nr:GNAT family N-acetyltransferase [Marinobacter sp. F4216]MBZ2169750.1 GNAT family N-acetyltransferase [Marinobacter sp. F4216]